MAKLVTTSDIATARRALELAEQECAHWDLEYGPGTDHDCCIAVHAADHALRQKRRLLKKDS